jgi:protein gp37
LERSGVSWATYRWNPWTGCDEVSAGCSFCYARTIAEKFPTGFPHGFALTRHPERLDDPLVTRQPGRVFVHSMSDTFFEPVPDSEIRRVFDVMARAHWLHFLFLTKRADRMLALAPRLPWPANVWAGVSVEWQREAWRLDRLRQVPATIRWVSVEPLIGPVQLDLTGIQWVVVGGETGPTHRPMDLAWLEAVVAQADATGATVYVKQDSGRVNDRQGRLPDALWRRKEFPA